MQSARLLLSLTLVIGAAACKRPVTLPTTEVPPARIRTVADVPPDREPAEGQTRVLGNGWYANVEVDGQDRVHLAWTDADLGDVMYAVSEPGSLELGEPVVVEHRGAVGSYLQLALAPGDVPVLAYYHQDDRTLRVAHRPADLPLMAEAGARLGEKVTRHEPRVLVPGEKPPPPPETGMGEGWHGEAVAYGDNAGLAGSLTVDAEGIPHIVYYASNERLRYATRPAGTAAFGEEVLGLWHKATVDEKAGGSYTMTTDVLVAHDAVLVSYAHWNHVDSQLKVALRKTDADASAFEVIEASPLRRMIDGWHSTLLPLDEGGQVEVFSVATGDAKLYRGVLDVEQPAPLEGRTTIIDRPGPTIVRRAPDGTLWVLTRALGLPQLNEKSGVSLIELPGGDPSKAHRYLLEEGLDRDPWIDLALRKDGTPIAVWTSRETLSMKLYVHER